MNFLKNYFICTVIIYKKLQYHKIMMIIIMIIVTKIVTTTHDNLVVKGTDETCASQIIELIKQLFLHAMQ